MGRPMRLTHLFRTGPFAMILAAAFATTGCGQGTGWILAPDCSHKTTLNAELHVDPSDDRWIWAIDRETGEAISLRIPGLYGVSTTTPPAIIDPAGNEIGRTGDLIVSGCHDVVQNAYQIDESDLRSIGP
jgi:hypothetical protein